MKSKLIFLLFAVFSLNAVNLSEEGKGFNFVLMHTDCKGNKLHAVFKLGDLRMCKFPSGPLLTNNIKKLTPVPNDLHLEVCGRSKELILLCIDSSKFDVGQSEDIYCGFSVPGSDGSAYVFSGLENVEHVSGVIISDHDLKQIRTRSAGVEEESEDEFDEIEALLANDIPPSQAMVLPAPVEKVKGFLIGMFLPWVLKYFDVRDKILLGLGYYKQKYFNKKYSIATKK